MENRLSRRFWSKVNLRTDDLDLCWEWIATARKGYGQFKYKGKMVDAHRVAWELTFGAIPGETLPKSKEKICVLHVCDNPGCCNPTHLYLGTQKDNAEDKVRKGRQSRGKSHGIKMRGEKNGCAKLTEARVLEIRETYKRGNISQRKLVAFYNVSQRQICSIIQGLLWQHIL